MSAHFRGEKPMSSAKILMTGIVSIVIQFGLAIAGRGDGARSLRILPCEHCPG